VTGSPAERKAEEWGAAKMKPSGWKMYTRKIPALAWMDTRHGAKGNCWSRIRRPLHVDAMGWTGSTPAGGAEGEVVAVISLQYRRKR